MRRTILLAVLACVMTLACSRRTPDEAVQLHRFERVLFATPAEQLQSELLSVREEYRTDLLNLAVEDPNFMQMVAGFVTDPTMRDIYRLTDSVFGDMEEESEQLGSALERAKELLPEIRYDKVFTYISGTFDYGMRVGCNSHELIISLDQYVLPYCEKYAYFGCPLYLVEQSRPEFLPTDCMTAVARERIVMPDHEMTMLDYMVAEGKAIYFAQQTLPDADDTLLLRYTAAQLDWIESNEENVWAYFLQNNLLYETDFAKFHNFVEDAPKTNAFRESAPRTTDYIGWRIVSGYAKQTGCSMKQLFDENDSQKILSQSNYRPK